MKTIGLILGAVLGTGAISSVQASDLFVMPGQGQANFYPANGYWTGVYLGGHVGAGWDSASWTDPFDGLADNPRSDAFIGGGQVGYNYQMGWLLLGAEADLTGTEFNATTTDTAGFTHNSRTDWTSTFTGRAGYAYNRLLVYAKGGAAVASDRETISPPFTTTGLTTTTTRAGWTVGAGVEFAIDRSWSVRLEYDYLGFGSQTLNLSLPGFANATAGINLEIQTVTAGINFRF
jgi:outer membrane immunogenic protein